MTRTDWTSFYTEWLGIPGTECPPDHYALLGVRRFESRVEVITEAADERMRTLKAQQLGRHAKACQEILNQVAMARVCLLDAARKREYDANLKAQTSAGCLAPLPEQIEKIQPDDLPMRAPEHLRFAPAPPASRVGASQDEWQSSLLGSLRDWRWAVPVGVGFIALLGLVIALIMRLSR